MFFLLEESHPHEPFKGMKTINGSIDVYGQTLHFRIGCKDGPARLSDIVPLAYGISDKMGDAAIANLAGDGHPVPCKKGCSFCCDYLVALSMPEVYYMQEKWAAWPDVPCDTVLRTCLRSAQKMMDLESLHKYNVTEEVDLSQISRWYRELELSCPFLHNNSCMIYEKRPLACREYLVTSAPRFCHKEVDGSVELVRLPVALPEVLGRLAADLEQTEVEAVFLPLVPVSIEQYKKRAERTWPAGDMVEHFMHILEAGELITNKELTEAT